MSDQSYFRTNDHLRLSRFGCRGVAVKSPKLFLPTAEDVFNADLRRRGEVLLMVLKSYEGGGTIYFTQGRRGWVRLHEKGGKEHEAPCHHKLETYLDEYIAATGIAGDKDGALFRTTGRATGIPRRMVQKDAYKVIERRARQAGIKTKVGNHSLRATGITDYLKAKGASLSEARKMANHASTRTTQLYDRRGDTASLDEYNRVGI